MERINAISSASCCFMRFFQPLARAPHVVTALLAAPPEPTKRASASASEEAAEPARDAPTMAMLAEPVMLMAVSATTAVVDPSKVALAEPAAEIVAAAMEAPDAVAVALPAAEIAVSAVVPPEASFHVEIQMMPTAFGVTDASKS